MVHIETGVIVDRFGSREEAEWWIDGYGVTQEYKDRCYRVAWREVRQ